MEINFDEIEIGAVETDVITEYPELENLSATPNTETQTFTHPNSYGYDNVTVNPIPSEYIIPTGELQITANGNYNVKQYETANVNIPITNNAQIDVNIKNNLVANPINKFIVSVPVFNTAELTDLRNLFYNCEALVDVPLFDTSNCTTLQRMFQNCKSIVTIPQFNTQSCQNMSEMFSTCTSLVNVPVLDTRSVTDFSYMFNKDTNLSDQSLNNIMQMCINATSYNGTKTLTTLAVPNDIKYRCQNLSNYQAFLDAGWTL